MNAALNVLNFLTMHGYENVSIMAEYDGFILRGDDVAMWINPDGELIATGCMPDPKSCAIEWNYKNGDGQNGTDRHARTLFAKANPAKK